MDKATRWFRAILGLKNKKSDMPSSSHSSQSSTIAKRRWSFVKSYRERQHPPHIHDATTTTGSLYAAGSVTVQEYERKKDDDENNHAVDAEAAVCAAHTAAAVVMFNCSCRCKSQAGGNVGVRTTECEASTVKIQAVFRGYLARKALRALKGLVRLQALVRGHIERKRTAYWLHRMQALMRAQARARAGRVLTLDSSHPSSKSSHLYPPGPPNPEKFELPDRTKGTNCERPSLLKRGGSNCTGRLIVDQGKVQSALNWSDRTGERLCDQRRTSIRFKSVYHEKCDKILEIDNMKADFTSTRKGLFRSSPNIALASEQSSRNTTNRTFQFSSSCEVGTPSPVILFSIHDVDEADSSTTENSPMFLSASARGSSSRSLFATPIKTDAYPSEFSDHPNYMSYTESSKAKVRSLSTPKQRPEYERSSSSSSSSKRNAIHGFEESRFSAQRTPAIEANSASKACPGSHHLNRLGMHNC